jgi:hypothetical protein
MGKINNARGKKKASPAKKKASSAKHSVTGGSPKERILNATARLGRVFDGSPPRDLVQIMAGYGNSEAGFKKQLTNLKKEGCLDLSVKNSMKVTKLGNKAVTIDDSAPVDTDGVHDCMREIIAQPKCRDAFDFLTDGRTRTKKALAAHLNYPDDSTPGFKKLLSQVKKHAFVEYVGKTQVRLEERAFPFGRPTM